jgi:hypothetical protein
MSASTQSTQGATTTPIDNQTGSLHFVPATLPSCVVSPGVIAPAGAGVLQAADLPANAGVRVLFDGTQVDTATTDASGALSRLLSVPVNTPSDRHLVTVRTTNSTAEAICDVVVNRPPTVDAQPSGPTPPAGSDIFARTGQNVSFTVQFSDADPGAAVAVDSVGLPAGATLTCQTGNSPKTCTFNWTPNATGAFLVTFTAIDQFGFAATPHTVAIGVRDGPPVTTPIVEPAPNANGWNNTTPVTVTLAAADNLGSSGIQSITYSATGAQPIAPFTATVANGQLVINQGFAGASTALPPITAEGITTITYAATDTAGNAETPKKLDVKIDKTAPEAAIQFDPVRKDVVLFGRDALSGVPTGPIAPVSVTPTRGGGAGEQRTYQLSDAAGNMLVLAVAVQRTGQVVQAQVVSLQYNGGPVLTPPTNQSDFAWVAERDGSLKQLQQRMVIGQGSSRRAVGASFDGTKNQTTIKVDSPPPNQQLVQPGLVLLRLTSDKGQLSIGF